MMTDNTDKIEPTQAANDTVADEIAACVRKSDVGGRSFAIFTPEIVGRRYVVMPLDTYREDVERPKRKVRELRAELERHRTAHSGEGRSNGAGEVAQALLPVPCHFCRCETQATTLHAAGIVWAQVECLNDDCSATGPCRDTEAEAISAWNAIAAHSLPGDVGMREALEDLLKWADNVCAAQQFGPQKAVARARAALTPSAVSGDAGEGRGWPPALTQGLREILGIPNFQCGPMAHAYQKIGEFSGDDGLPLEKRAEDEQAFILHKLVGFWFEHGDGWREPAIDEIDRAAKLARAASHQGAGEP